MGDLTNTGVSPKNYDLILLGDMSRGGDSCLRIRQEILTYHDHGYKIALIHVPFAGAAKTISPDIQLCVREDKADAVSADACLRAKLVIVFSPGVLKNPVGDLKNLSAKRVILVVDRIPNPRQMGLWHSFSVGPVSWAPTNRWVRAKLQTLGLPVPIEREDWRSIARPLRQGHTSTRSAGRIVIGRVSVPGAAQWPKTASEFEKTYKTDATIDFRVLGRPPAELVQMQGISSEWWMPGFSDTSVERFVEMLDGFMYYPSANSPELPEAAIAAAMASGKVVVLPPRFKPHFGPGAIYAEPESAIDAIKDLFADKENLEEAREAAKHHASLQFSEARHIEKIRNFAKPSTRRRKTRRL